MAPVQSDISFVSLSDMFSLDRQLFVVSGWALFLFFSRTRPYILSAAPNVSCKGQNTLFTVSRKFRDKLKLSTTSSASIRSQKIKLAVFYIKVCYLPKCQFLYTVLLLSVGSQNRNA